MLKPRRSFVFKSLFVLAVAAVSFAAVETLTSGLIPVAHATCLAPTGCGYAPVTCSNGVTYPNICTAAENCQYNCCNGGVPPHPPHGCLPVE